jgi:hypothetical protein
MERLRDHYAEGRLTHDEFDERITTTLGARTFGELRRVLVDLPEPGRLPALAAGRPGGPPRPMTASHAPVYWQRRRGPRVLPLLLVALVITLLVTGGGAAAAAVAVKVIAITVAVMLGIFVLTAFTAARLFHHARSHHDRHWHHQHHWHQRGHWS